MTYASSQATAIFHAWAQLPISIDEYTARSAVLQRQYFPSCQPLPGALELLQTLNAPTTTSSSTINTTTSSRPSNIHIALATSSHSANYDLKTTHLPHLTSQFIPESIVKGDDPRVAPGRGKPAPDIYLLALETINARLRASGTKEPDILPSECLVFEDSVPGVEAGRRAGMQVLWCPHAGLLQEYAGREEEVLAGLTGEHKEEEEDILADVSEEIKNAAGNDANEAVRRRKHGPGVVGDGWGRLVKSLEAFPYGEYGISVAA